MHPNINKLIEDHRAAMLRARAKLRTEIQRSWGLDNEIPEITTFLEKLMSQEATIIGAMTTVINNQAAQIATLQTTQRDSADLAAEQAAEAIPAVAAILNPTPTPPAPAAPAPDPTAAPVAPAPTA